ncbi:bifunctional glutamate N-acetyltransferase/amino-acid acetyltransferase ArgJ [Armatimonas sp.]|uniref:bifunctional glutamate N-acetyltransferase/amino-acid acetyltransferase ArgJ n=1 Tax=Armatimonas sp. TaxID=1872638 RepID=UPI00286CB43E|nr:bifunctional glutamate N-acetyltransferase/amino-acid acetyltransferase ArgJ [Armatimonas sp.]
MAVTFPVGFRAHGVAAGIKKSGALDMALLWVLGLPDRVSAAMVGTQNQMCAPSVTRNRRVLEETGGFVKAIIINAGCANVATGPEGIADNERMAELVILESLARLESDALPNTILTASTGVIGVRLPMDKIAAGIHKLHEVGRTEGIAENFAEAIMTTDLVPKTAQIAFELNGYEVRIGGACKGSGMIAPNMATMLAFLTTDAGISPEALDVALRRAVDVSFNCMTVDGDTSTSDQCILLASGAAGNDFIEEPEGPDFEAFVAALSEVCITLAKKVARDGEGATKLVEVRVTGAPSDADAKKVGRTIAESPLVKTALFGNDPNWGRLMMAAGRAGVPFDPDNASATLAGIEVFKNGVPAAFDKAAASEAMKTDEVLVTVDLGAGDGKATFYTCDFSYEYVKINAEYTT